MDINLIGIYGENGVGKSTTARIISNLTGMEIRSFATPVKVMAAAYLNVPVESFEDRDFKEKHRDLLITIGDGIREKDPDFWVNHLFKSNKKYNWVIDDVRKPNEIEAIRERGGIIVRVIRGPYTHKGDLWTEYTINNRGTIEELRFKVELSVVLEKTGFDLDNNIKF